MRKANNKAIKSKPYLREYLENVTVMTLECVYAFAVPERSYYFRNTERSTGQIDWSLNPTLPSYYRGGGRRIIIIIVIIIMSLENNEN